MTPLLKVRCPKKLDFWGTLKVMRIEKYSLICYYIYRIEENVKCRRRTVKGEIKMGSWGVKLYQSDIADMVRDDYKNKLRAGKSDEETLEEMLIEYQYERADDEDKFDYWPALADTMWKYGRLTPKVRDIC